MSLPKPTEVVVDDPRFSPPPRTVEEVKKFVEAHIGSRLQEAFLSAEEAERSIRASLVQALASVGFDLQEPAVEFIERVETLWGLVWQDTGQLADVNEFCINIQLPQPADGHFESIIDNPNNLLEE